jgi:GDP-L-fucose synthase
MIINKNDKIMVTGASGWLGSYILKELRIRGYTDIFELNGRGHIDLCNHEAVKTLFKCIKPDHIIHLAAKVNGILGNLKDPIGHYIYNARMGQNLIEESLNNNIKKFLLVSTVCAYPKIPNTIPFIPEEIWDGRPEETNEAYSLAKKSIQLLLEKCRDRMLGITVIPTNIYGPNFDGDTHCIPEIIKKIHHANTKKEDVILYGSGNASREFIFVNDASTGIVDCFEKYEGDNGINLGSGEEITIKDLTNKIAEIMNFNGKIRFDGVNPDGQPRRFLNCSEILKMGWSPKVSLQEGLEATIDWFKCQNLN